MTTATFLSVPRNRYIPSACTGLPSMPEPCAVVHVIHPDEEMAARTADLCTAAGIETRVYANVGAFARADPPSAPGCLIVHMPPPPVDGLEHLPSFRRREARLPMIVTADHADVRTAVLAMKAGAVDFFERPMRESDLLESVESAIRADRTRRHAEAHRAELMARFDTLTVRERQVMAHVTQGRLNKQVAGDLGLSEITVKVHRGSAMRKMGARTLAALVRMADMIAQDEQVDED